MISKPFPKLQPPLFVGSIVALGIALLVLGSNDALLSWLISESATFWFSGFIIKAALV